MWAIWCYRPISNTIGIDYIIDPLGFLINLGPVPNVNQKKALVLSIKAIADSSALFRLCVCYTLLVETILIIDTQEQSWNSPFDLFIFIFYCILRGIFRVFAGGRTTNTPKTRHNIIFLRVTVPNFSAVSMDF